MVTATPNVSIKSLDNAKSSMMVQLPLKLIVQIERDADEAGMKKTAFLRKLIAEHYGYELPASQMGRAKIYASDEERKAHQKAKDEAKREVIAKMLAAMREGGEDAALAILNQMNSETESDE